MPGMPVVARAPFTFGKSRLFRTAGSRDCLLFGLLPRLVYCQNESISHENFGKVISPARLREIFLSLVSQGAHNVELVNPTHFSHVLERVLAQPLPVPVVWNSGGYERVETLRTLEGKVDVFLPDLKYLDAEGAARYSGAADYPRAATEAVREMVRQTGPYILEDGLLRRGVLIRHLILPAGWPPPGMSWIGWPAAFRRARFFFLL
jgi:putative pyruvate formate lyase activating enzyme